MENYEPSHSMSSTTGKQGSMRFLLSIIGVLTHLVQKLSCQPPVEITLDQGMRNLKQSDYIPISSLHELGVREGIFSRTNDKAGVFTHGAPLWSKLSGIEPDNLCHSYVRTEFALALICGKIVYLLDSETYARQWTHKFNGPILEFTSYSSKILIVIGTTDRKKATLYILDTFDLTLTESQDLFQGWLRGATLKAVYLELKTRAFHGAHGAYLLLYETPYYFMGSKIIPINDEIIMVPIDVYGDQEPKSPKVKLKLRELRTAGGERLVKDEGKNATILEVSNFGYKLFVFYSELPGVWIRGLILDSVIGTEVISFDVNNTEPISFKKNVFPESFKQHTVVWSIPKTLLFGFYSAFFGELVICEVGIEGEDWQTSACSNRFQVAVVGQVPGSYLIYGFNKIIYNRLGKTILLHLEVKSRCTENKTLYSTLLEFGEETFILRETTYWDVGPSKYHYLKTTDSVTDIAKYELVALKRQSFQAYRTTMQYIKVTYDLLNANSQNVRIYDDFVEVSLLFSSLKHTELATQTKDYNLTLRTKLVYAYSGLLVSKVSDQAAQKEVYVRSADRVVLPLSEFDVFGTDLRHNFDHIIKEQRPIIKLQQDKILSGTLFSEKVDDLIQLDILPDRPIVDLRIQGSYLLLLSKWFPREQLTKGYLYWCDPDVFVSPSVATHTELSCLLLRSFTVGKEVLLKEVFDLNYFVVVQLQADNAVVYAKFDKIEFSCVVLEAKGYTPSKVLMAEHDINTVMVAQYRPNNFKSFTLFQMTGEQLVRLPDLPLAPFFSSSYGRFEVPYFGLWATRDGVVLQLIMNYTTSLSQATFGLSPGQVPTRRSLNSDLMANDSPVDLCFLPGKIVYTRASWSVGFTPTWPIHQSSTLQQESVLTLRLWVFSSTDTDVEKYFKFPEQLKEIEGITEVLDLKCVPSFNLIYLRFARKTNSPDAYKISNVFISADIDGQATDSIL